MNVLISIVLILALLGGIGFQQWRLERTQEKAAEWKTAVAQYEEADKKNQAAIAECEAVAQRNKVEAERQRREAGEAVERVVDLRARLQERLEAMEHESTQLHNQVQGDCPAAHDRNFVDSLYQRP